jgi:hypothetical protein
VACHQELAPPPNRFGPPCPEAITGRSLPFLAERTIVLEGGEGYVQPCPEAITGRTLPFLDGRTIVLEGGEGYVVAGTVGCARPGCGIEAQKWSRPSAWRT